MNPETLKVWAISLFGFFIIGAITLYILVIFFDPASPTTGIFTNNSYAANVTVKILQGIYNIFEQVPNAGKLIGVSLIIGVTALLGFGGYMGYKKIKG